LALDLTTSKSFFKRCFPLSENLSQESGFFEFLTDVLLLLVASVVDPKQFFSNPDSDPIFVRVLDPESDPDPL
jgi:hypothetical protein